MIDTIQILKSTIGNPATRKILSSAGFCDRCGKSRLETALELYVGVRKDACIRCRLAEKTLSGILKAGGGTFGVSEDLLKERFKESYWRRGLINVLKGIATFGVQRPFVPGAPFLVVWDVTYACNLRCKHCYATAGKAIQDELSTEEALAAIDKLDRLGCVILAFSGGEPLIRRDIFQLTKYAAEKGMYVAIASNGTLITRDMARKIKESGVSYVQISLDGATAKTHDEFRGITGAFDKTIQGIKNCVSEGFFVNVSTVVTHHNLKEVPDIISLCEELGVDWFMHYNFVPTGRGKDIIKDDLTPEEREDLLKMLYNRNKTSKVKILSTAPQFARVALQCDAKMIPTHFYNFEPEGKLKSLAEFIGGCGAGRFYMSMRANGDIQPCVFFPLKVGNIRDTDIEDLWKNNEVFRVLRNKDMLHGHCGSCKYRYYCGGCRARAYGYLSDICGPDVGCINNREVYKKLRV